MKFFPWYPWHLVAWLSSKIQLCVHHKTFQFLVITLIQLEEQRSLSLVERSNNKVGRTSGGKVIRWSLSFKLGPLHWTPREHRRIVEICSIRKGGSAMNLNISMSLLVSLFDIVSRCRKYNYISSSGGDHNDNKQRISFEWEGTHPLSVRQTPPDDDDSEIFRAGKL